MYHLYSSNIFASWVWLGTVISCFIDLKTEFLPLVVVVCMPDYGKGSGVSWEAVSVENSDHIDHNDMVSGLCGSTYAIQDGAKNKIWIRIKLKIAV